MMPPKLTSKDPKQGKTQHKTWSKQHEKWPIGSYDPGDRRQGLDQLVHDLPHTCNAPAQPPAVRQTTADVPAA